jgi:dipeptidyl aminopeptidase/acylaminoacyl peptidase
MKKIVYFIMVPLLLAVPSFSQKSKKPVTVSDYAKWSTILDERLSPDGKWVSYTLNYDYGADTTFIQQIKSGKKTAFADTGNSLFSKNGKYFATVGNNAVLTLLNLDSGKRKSYIRVIDFEFSEKTLAILSKDEKDQKLVLVDLGTGKEMMFQECIEFSMAKSSKVAIATKNCLYIVDNKKIDTLPLAVEETESGYKKIVWNENSNAISFLEPFTDENGNRSHKVYYYNLSNHKISCLNPIMTSELKGQMIFGEGKSPLKFSSDGSQVFFYYSEPKKKDVNEPFEIWDSETPYEYGWNKVYGNPNTLNKMAQWQPNNNKVDFIGTNIRPNVMLTIKGKYSVCYNIKQYEPQYEQVAPADFYLKNNKTGEESVLLTKQSTAPGLTGVSPKGNYIYYFRDSNWWVYDMQKGIHQNVTATIPILVSNEEHQVPGPAYPYISPGWSADEKYFIVYDQFDMWLINILDYSARRITRGKETNVQFRLCEELYPLVRTQDKDEYFVRNIDFSKGLIVVARSGNGESGYYRMNPDLSVSKMIFGNSGKSRLQKAEHTDDYIFIEQTAVNPPKIVHFKGNQPAKLVFQSNQFAEYYSWGKAELLEYKNKDGMPLKSILYKPSDYVPGKKYPMVVYIYEKLSDGLHQYSIPTEYGPIGFAASNYFLDGYLVLFPDIHYKVGSPGISALECVELAVNTVKKLNIVEENHIGIIGHSFGGYETNFIITQTNIFAAAVSGSALSNMISSYFTYLAQARRSNAWKYETQQMRMGFSPFDDWNDYQRNSALPNLEKCTTPLLSWAGKNDGAVYWMEGAQFHMAFRRLEKKNVFIVYSKEGHTIKTASVQRDLTIRTKDWFDHYLKPESSKK